MTLAWIPGFFTLPALDRDEARFAQATKQMLETGDFIDIRFGDEPRYKKPAGIHWLQAASTSVFGSGPLNQIWTYRIPSLLGAFAAVLLTFFGMRRLGGTETAFVSALLLGASVLVMAESKIAKTDAALLATIAGAQFVLLRAYAAGRVPGAVPPKLGLALFGWACFGFGILVKGPIIVLVSGGTVALLALWDRDWRFLSRLHSRAGIPLALAIALPWYIAIAVKSGGQFFDLAIGEDLAPKIMSGQETHGAPPGYYTLLAHVTFWPATLFLWPALAFAFRQRASAIVRFLLVWAAVTWVAFELAPTKLPHYVMPAYPALAALCGWWFVRTTGEGERTARLVSAVLFAGGGVALAVFVAWAPTEYGGGTPWWLVAWCVGVAALVLTAGALVLSRRNEPALCIAILAMLGLYAVTGFGAAPRLSDLWLTARLASAVERHAQPGDPPVISSGYGEASMRFVLGTKTHLVPGDEAGTIAAREGGLVLVEESQMAAFQTAVSAAQLERLEEIDGLNYSRGQPMRVVLYRVQRGS